MLPGRGGGERLYRATARRLLLDRTTFASPAAGEALESVLAFVFDRTRLDIRDAARSGAVDLQRRAPDPASLVAWRNVLRLPPEAAERLYREIDALWKTYDAPPDSTSGDARLYTFAVALCPMAAGLESAAAADEAGSGETHPRSQRASQAAPSTRKPAVHAGRRSRKDSARGR